MLQDQGGVPGWDSPPAFGSVSVEAIQETSEIVIFADQQWPTCNHQWCWAVTSCPGKDT